MTAPEPLRAMLDVQVERIAPGGAALARDGGKVMFVRGALPGERVRVEITRRGRTHDLAVVREVLEASPDRVEPRCPHAGFAESSCGGCEWQHVAYEAQLRFKREIVAEQLRRIGGIEAPVVREMLGAPSPFGWRNHVQLGLTQEGLPGYQAAASHRVVPVSQCPIASPSIDRWIRDHAGGMAGEEPGRRRIVIRHDEASGKTIAWRPGEEADTPAATLHAGDVPFRVSAESFFQVHTALLATLVDLVLAALEPRTTDTVLDAYSGAGLFARFLAPIVRRLVAIDCSTSAIADARVNLADLSTVELHEGLVEETLPRVRGPIDAAVLDPPRAGCRPREVELLARRVEERLAYVSCDPATLARDLRRFLGLGWELREVQPIDLFPHTPHIECVAVLEKR